MARGSVVADRVGDPLGRRPMDGRHSSFRSRRPKLPEHLFFPPQWPYIANMRPFRDSTTTTTVTAHPGGSVVVLVP